MNSLKPFLLALLVSLATFAQGQTVAAKPGTLADVAFLDGRWAGTFNGGPIEAGWTAPLADNIVGYIRMMKDGKPTLYEMFVFEQTERGPVAMVKHFRPGLIGVEDKEKSDRYVFLSAEPNRALFEKEDGSLRIIYERRKPSQLVIQRGELKNGQWAFVDLFVFERQP